MSKGTKIEMVGLGAKSEEKGGGEIRTKRRGRLSVGKRNGEERTEEEEGPGVGTGGKGLAVVTGGDRNCAPGY